MVRVPWPLKSAFFLCLSFLLIAPRPAFAHDTDLPEWVRVSTACILDVYAREGGLEVLVDLRRPDALAVLGEKSWDPHRIPPAMADRILRGLSLGGRFPEKVLPRSDSKMYERWSATWTGPLPAEFDLKVSLFDQLPGSGWCQVFVIPEIGGEPEQSFFFKGDQVFHWPRTLTMPGMTWGRFFHLGFLHILPLGTDHILFVLGLCLAARTLGSLLGQITAFTLAHTLTLGLAAKGVISLSPSVVEPLIAASILLVALENIRKKEPPPWRWMVVFCFGLVHGLGFAGALLDSGLPAGAFLSSLFAFNLGVEAGQLTVVALGLAAFWRLRDKEWFRTRLLVPASLGIAVIGAFWTLERIWRAFS